MGNGVKVWVEAVGDLELIFDCNRVILLNDILYVPGFQ
jgi:hypothetical protein